MTDVQMAGLAVWFVLVCAAGWLYTRFGGNRPPTKKEDV